MQYWLYLIGALFVFVVMFLPGGLASLLDKLRPGKKVRRGAIGTEALKTETR